MRNCWAATLLRSDWSAEWKAGREGQEVSNEQSHWHYYLFDNQGYNFYQKLTLKYYRIYIIVPSYKMKGRYCTVVLVRSFQVISISQQSPDSLSQTVFVWLLGSLIKQNVGDQTRISTILHILRLKKQMWVGESKHECFPYIITITDVPVNKVCRV